MREKPPVRTMGVEEEFLLVDRRTRAPVPRAPQVIRQLTPVLGDLVQVELYRSMVEIRTRPTASAADLRAQLAAMRATVAEAARDAGCLLLASGTPVVPPARPIPVTDTPRYRRMAARCCAIVDGVGGTTCGCHVHIGTLDRSCALELSNHLRPWLPTLQALAANSPFHAGRDSGFASRRSVEADRWPTAGPPPLLDRAGYETTADALVSSGVLLDRRMIYWYARPSEHVPTLEVRIADVNADLDGTVLIAALVRGLCTALLSDIGEGRPPPQVPIGRLRAAHWHAARFGATGHGLDPLTGHMVPTRLLIERLLGRAAPGLAAAGDLAAVERLLTRHLVLGTGADRQRAHHRRTGSLRQVVDHMAALTAANRGV
ncbi:glutamate--cysteine ligase [Streptomyces sp. NPDC007861]|uniref:carboxylate-amine ligase n=1 Tax=Streptomyces sp. NPDC007861 TaxID=3154893 RepID=UPI0034060FDA